MKVCVAAQVFSHSVAATMNLLIINKGSLWSETTLSEDARGTVDLVKFIDDVFDSVNGSAKKDLKGKPLRTSVSMEERSIHEGCWNVAIQVFQSMYVVENGQKKVMPCFNNWLITLKGLKILRKQLKLFGFSRIKTRRFNQDPVENLFGRIRQRGQRFTKPTCKAFGTFYKSLLLNGLVSKLSVGSNCEDDEGSILVSLQKFITHVKRNKSR
ncbi:uncharacterized protein LOC108907288 [Anoplophora glabripennis]|uniref:uncharacterized protein LOC108907288 n=1 Tax=Anoplophora glabripennis TaxID=217634 RepID=UPI0008746FDA|nr:uncharacterized protein LOC108907288 [Anoplophora glabripennis]